MAKIKWTEDDKQRAATELMNARQNLKELGPLARKADVDRVTKAEKEYKKITGRNP